MRTPINATNYSQRELIRALGGPEAVAELIHSLTRASVTPRHISVMSSRGIPWHFRPALARIASERCIPLPAGFLGYEIAA